MLILDSNWRDKEVALFLFLNEQDAVDYARGERRKTNIGWLAHNEGWDAEGYLEAWIERSLSDHDKRQQQIIATAESPCFDAQAPALAHAQL